MTFWSSETFQQQGKLHALVAPFDQTRIVHGAYELSLGKEAYVTSSKDGKKTTLGNDEQFVIPPGQFAMLLTEEVVKIPASAIGLISIKAGIKFRGLVNVSGFHVDPGYKGRLKFSVYNAGSKNIVLVRNRPVFLLWLNNLDVPTADHYSASEANNEITANDVMNIQGEVASPGELKCAIDTLRQDLKREVDGLRHSMRVSIWAVGIVFAVFLALYGLLAGAFLKSADRPAATPATAGAAAEKEKPPAGAKAADQGEKTKLKEGAAK